MLDYKIEQELSYFIWFFILDNLIIFYCNSLSNRIGHKLLQLIPSLHVQYTYYIMTARHIQDAFIDCNIISTLRGNGYTTKSRDSE